MQVMDSRYAFHGFELFDDPLGVDAYWHLFEENPERFPREFHGARQDECRNDEGGYRVGP